MAQRETLTTEAGAPVTDNQHAQTAERPGRCSCRMTTTDQERLLRTVSAFASGSLAGSAAMVTLEVTSPDVPRG